MEMMGANKYVDRESICGVIWECNRHDGCHMDGDAAQVEKKDCDKYSINK